MLFYIEISIFRYIYTYKVKNKTVFNEIYSFNSSKIFSFTKKAKYLESLYFIIFLSLVSISG